METSEIFSSDKATVVIQVNPQEAQDNIIYVDGQKKHRNNASLEGFCKAQPRALGTVQIMIGVMVFSLGVLLSTGPPLALVYSGITYWGSLIYISAGSLSVVAQNKHDLCVVKASLGLNVFSAVTAGISILFIGIEIFALLQFHPDFKAEVLRIIAILLVFTISQFFIAVCISGFACKASCNSQSTVINVALNRVTESQ